LGTKVPVALGVMLRTLLSALQPNLSAQAGPTHNLS
jgi:hypothetical protein